MTGFRGTFTRFTSPVAGALTPPWPSVTTARMVRDTGRVISEAFEKVMLRSRACAASGVAEALSAMTSGDAPSAPPDRVPMLTP